MKRKIFSKKVMFFSGRKDTIGKEQALIKALNKNKTFYERMIKECREAHASGDLKLYKKLKQQLPLFMVSGSLEGERCVDNVVKYTQVMILDFDKLGEQLKEVRKKIEANPQTMFTMLSPSGDGLKVLVVVDSLIEQHKIAFKQVSSHFEKLTGVKLDASGSDVSRLCYFSYDPDLYWNKDYKVFGVKEQQVTLQKRDTSPIQVTGILSVQIESIERVHDFLEENGLSLTEDRNDWRNVGWAFASIGDYEIGKNLFLKFSQLDKEIYEEEECLKQWGILFNGYKSEGGSITLGTFYYLAKEKGFNLKNEAKELAQFWEFIPKKGDGYELQINRYKLFEFWKLKNFRVYDRNTRAVLVKVEDNLIEEISFEDVKRDLIKHLETNVGFELEYGFTRDQLIEKVMKSIDSLVNKNMYGFLEKANEQEHWDTKSVSSFYFGNGVVNVSSTGVTIEPYSTLEGVIWKSKINPHKLNIDQSEESDFEKFVHRTVDNDPDKIDALESTIGYMLDRYKDPANPRAIVLMDESFELKEAEGGSGKSLIFDAVSQMRNMIKLDGKDYKKHRFSLQNVMMDTEIVFFDDLNPDMDFRHFYPMITTDMNVEKKGKQSFIIPFGRSPKLGISTNYGMGHSTEGSSIRRKFEVEIGHYYSVRHRPIDEFGIEFFSPDWTETNWNNFYLYMFRCLKKFKANGLMEYDRTDMKDKHLRAEIGSVFVEYADGIKRNVEHEMKKLLRKYNRKMNAKIEQRSFNDLLKKYIVMKEIDTRAYREGKRLPWRESNSKAFLMMIE
jgi:hypothetical protein